MAKATKRKTPKTKTPRKPLRWLMWQSVRLVSVVFLVSVFLVVVGTVLNPFTTIYMSQEARRLGGVDYEWVPLEEIAPVMARSVVAAEDANFCQCTGVLMSSCDSKYCSCEDGSAGGCVDAEPADRQKRLFVARSRTYGCARRLEAVGTPCWSRRLWSKAKSMSWRCILNVAEFDARACSGSSAASRHYFGVESRKI